MADHFKTYLQSLRSDLARGNASEHTHRLSLKILLESLGERLTATNEPRQVTDCGKPDMAVYQGPVLLGYVERVKTRTGGRIREGVLWDCDRGQRPVKG